MMTDPGWSVVEVPATDTHDLRRRVLRSGTISAEVVFDGDELPGTAHLAVVTSGGAGTAPGRVVAVSTWVERAEPGGPTDVRSARRPLQLRGMATDPEWRGLGLGAALLEAGLLRAERLGADLVWANARDTAVGFYRSHGFHVHEPGFVDPTTGLPHHRVRRPLPSSP